ncbi:reverse transcriptase [Plakobranchus ocellatus]|uniref:Reverse transcriptase n=1 Tax=Plakobranchus ocellatus TaxID=259542 RepID=A0AAV4DQS7_9GAST|nr:reverse transcriptase [Plakobranchus ocellatus]
MGLKPKRFQSLSIRKGKLDEDVRFKVASQDITRINEDYLKSLVRLYDSFLKHYIKLKCNCPKSTKCRVSFWPFVVYETSTSTMELKEAKINMFSGRVLPGLTDVSKFCRKTKLRLSLKAKIEKCKCGNAKLMNVRRLRGSSSEIHSAPAKN